MYRFFRSMFRDVNESESESESASESESSASEYESCREDVGVEVSVLRKEVERLRGVVESEVESRKKMEERFGRLEERLRGAMRRETERKKQEEETERARKQKRRNERERKERENRREERERREKRKLSEIVRSVVAEEANKKIEKKKIKKG